MRSLVGQLNLVKQYFTLKGGQFEFSPMLFCFTDQPQVNVSRVRNPMTAFFIRRRFDLMLAKFASPNNPHARNTVFNPPAFHLEGFGST